MSTTDRRTAPTSSYLRAASLTACSALAVSLLGGCARQGLQPALATPLGTSGDPTASEHAPFVAAPPAGAPAAAPAPGAETAAETSEKLPIACADRAKGDRGSCTPPQDFVVRICGGNFPEAALAMFRGGTPWTRGFVKNDVEAWQANRRTRDAALLQRDEEVIVLIDRTKGSGILVGGGSYDVLRWDGTCASLMADELTMTRPPVSAGFAEIPWRRLDAPVREALGADRKIAAADADHKRACRGATMGAKSIACRKADTRLGMLVVERIRGGAPLPAPDLR
ncbi:MAG: hypothetical protein WKG00_33570 [Polyangiaceae bacterium]